MPDQNENNSDKRQSWWSTLPGVLTAVAGLIAALTALIAALHAAGVWGATTTTSTTTTATETHGTFAPDTSGTGSGTGTHADTATTATTATTETHPPPPPPAPKRYNAYALHLERHDHQPGEDSMITYHDVGPAKVHYYDNQDPRAGLDVSANGAREQFSLFPGESKTLTFGPIKVIVKLLSQSPSEAVVDVDVTEQQ